MRKSIFEKEAFSRKSPLNCLFTYRSMRGAVTQCCDAGAMSRHTQLPAACTEAVWGNLEQSGAPGRGTLTHDIDLQTHLETEYTNPAKLISWREERDQPAPLLREPSK